MDVPYLLEQVMDSSSSSSMRRKKIHEQKGGLHFIAYMIVQILTFVFEKVLLPIVQLLFQLPEFYKEVDKKSPDGKFLDAEGKVLENQDDPTVRIKEKKLRTFLGIIPTPKYTEESEGKGYFWRFVKQCIKLSAGLVIGMLGGIYLVLGGLGYMVVKIFKDFTEKPRAISKKYEESKN